MFNFGLVKVSQDVLDAEWLFIRWGDGTVRYVHRRTDGSWNPHPFAKAGIPA